MMKSKVPLIVKDETGRKIETHVQNQERHTFIRIEELDITINTAEVEAIYTEKQYTEATRVKNGDWLCDRFNWHTKGEKCECRKREAEEIRKKNQEKEDEERSRPLTEEQIAKNKKRMAEIRESLKGVGKIPTKQL